MPIYSDRLRVNPGLITQVTQSAMNGAAPLCLCLSLNTYICIHIYMHYIHAYIHAYI